MVMELCCCRASFSAAVDHSKRVLAMEQQGQQTDQELQKATQVAEQQQATASCTRVSVCVVPNVCTCVIVLGV